MNCPHCHSTAPQVLCDKCKRTMCQECISGPAGNYRNLCGLCYDDEIARSRFAIRDEYRRGVK